MKFNRSMLGNVTIALAVAAAFGTVSVYAADPQERNLRFEKFDKNKDGFISRDEVVGERWLDRAFGQADDNKDGMLDRAEFIKADAIQDRIAAGNYVSDTTLKAKVKTVLLRERGLKSRDLDVEVLGGEVLLSGFVRDEEQRSKALRAANSVRGVVAVNDKMVVR
jgi:BON domain-containing protein/EF hand domain-containing protein